MIDTTNEKAVEQAKLRFEYLNREWDEAGRECARLYNIWQAACDRRLRLKMDKNNAWGELEMARAMAHSNGHQGGEA